MLTVVVEVRGRVAEEPGGAVLVKIRNGVWYIRSYNPRIDRSIYQELVIEVLSFMIRQASMLRTRHPTVARVLDPKFEFGYMDTRAIGILYSEAGYWIAVLIGVIGAGYSPGTFCMCFLEFMGIECGEDRGVWYVVVLVAYGFNWLECHDSPHKFES